MMGRQFKDFKKLLIANTNRFTQPEGSLPRISNLLGTVRGSLVTCDGTRIISSVSGSGVTPGYALKLVALGQVFPIAGSSSIVGLFVDASGTNYTVANMSTDPWTTVGTFTGNPSTYPPKITQTMSGVIFTTDYTNTVYQWSGVSGAPLETVTNTFDASNVSAIWESLATYPPGSLVVPQSGNGYFYLASPGGIAGSSEPSFSTTPGSSTPDGVTGLAWINEGSITAEAPPGAMHAIYHEGSVWLGGVGLLTDTLTVTGSSAIWMSDLEDLQSYNPLNTTYIGREDGQRCTGLNSMSIAEFGIAPQSALVGFKEYSTYQLMGVFGSSNFAIAQAQTNMGCVAPRTALFMSGVGIIRMSHLGVAVFDGMRDRVISEEIRPYLFEEWSEPDIPLIDWNNIGQGIASIVANPPMYVMGMPTVGSNGDIYMLFVYDFVLQSWTIVNLPFAISSMAQVITENNQPMTIFGGSSDGTLRRWQYGDNGWDSESTPVQWYFRTPELFADPQSLNYYRWMQLRVKDGRSAPASGVSGSSMTDNNPRLPVTLRYEFLSLNSQTGGYNTGLYGSSFYQPNSREGFVNVGINRMAYSGYINMMGTGNIEIQSFSVDMQPQPGGTLGRPV
jgi:hypothetical protein